MNFTPQKKRPSTKDYNSGQSSIILSHMKIKISFDLFEKRNSSPISKKLYIFSLSCASISRELTIPLLVKTPFFECSLEEPRLNRELGTLLYFLVHVFLTRIGHFCLTVSFMTRSLQSWKENELGQTVDLTALANDSGTANVEENARCWLITNASH